MQETRVGSLGQEGPLEKEMANLLQSSYLENSIDRGAWWAIQSIVCKELDMTVCSANTCTHIDLNQLFYILPLIGTLVTFTPPLR